VGVDKVFKAEFKLEFRMDLNEFELIIYDLAFEAFNDSLESEVKLY